MYVFFDERYMCVKKYHKFLIVNVDLLSQALIEYTWANFNCSLKKNYMQIKVYNCNLNYFFPLYVEPNNLEQTYFNHDDVFSNVLCKSLLSTICDRRSIIEISR